MTIVFGILLYVLCIAFLCALTGINRLGDSEPQKRLARPLAVRTSPASTGQVPASEAHG